MSIDIFQTCALNWEFTFNTDFYLMFLQTCILWFERRRRLKRVIAELVLRRLRASQY